MTTTKTGFSGLYPMTLAFFDAAIEVAAACPSTAWVLGVVAVHNWQLALFPEEAQHDVWEDDPDTRVKIVKTAYDDMMGLFRLRFGGLRRASRRLRDEKR